MRGSANGSVSVSPARNRSRMASVERGARVAETGSLLRNGSVGHGGGGIPGSSSGGVSATGNPGVSGSAEPA